MKTKSILAALLLIVAGVQTTRAQKMTVNLTNGKTVVYRVSQVESVTFDETASDYDFVDLGLPSGTLWATCNVGATAPEEYGDFFTWGDPVPSTSDDWASYKWATPDGENLKILKYTFDDGCTDYNWYNSAGDFIGDGKRVLDAEDDAATVNWGSDWRTPSIAQLCELMDEDNTKCEWTTQDGVNGLKVTSKANGNSIFLPAAGYIETDQVLGQGEAGFYWSRSLRYSTFYADFMFLKKDEQLTQMAGRSYPMSVRPVYAAETAPILVTSIELNQTSLILKVNKTATLYAEVSPYYADNTEVVWESSNKSVAQVSDEGKVTAIAAGICTITCRAADGGGAKAECQVTVTDAPDTKEYVDLGLPSGTLWATCNVGASIPEEYGDYFAWGETQPKADYRWATYQLITPGQNSQKYINKYTVADNWSSYSWYDGNNFIGDNKTELDAEDDAATANWGSDWKMPTEGQFEELSDETNTTIESVTQNGVAGMKITSKINGNSIFLPYAGRMYDTDIYDGDRAWYWTSSLSSISVDAILGSSGGCSADDRYIGMTVRPVSAKTNNILVSSIELSETSLTLNIADTKLLTATVLPENATNKKVWWESSDMNVARVSIEGLVMAIDPGTCTITCRADDGSEVEAVCQVTVLASHEYVDLGLPSGTLWATCNVGADDPEDYGDYFAWGETQPKSDYSWSSYKWMPEGQASWEWINKYTFADNQKTASWYDGDTFIGDGKKVLLPADDAATANWGSDWQTPSQEQCEELMNAAYTTTTWTTQNGVKGLKITGTNGNSIFLPAGGSMNGTNLMNDGVNGQYWSRSLYKTYADYGYNMLASSSGLGMAGLSRHYGHCIRPVRVKANTSDYDYVEIGGVKWATMNVGATTVAGSYETCYGDYFAWSETEPRYTSITRMSASEATFTWKSDFSSGHSYDSPNYVGTTLDEAHDAATAKWGDSWRTPTVEDFEALAKACSGFVTNGQRPVELINTITEGGIYWLSSTQTIESAYTGVAGLLFVSKADINKRVFFPATGRVNDTSLNNGGSCGTYWSSSRFQSTGAAYHLYFDSSAVSPSSNYAFRRGQTVRAVRK